MRENFEVYNDAENLEHVGSHITSVEVESFENLEQIRRIGKSKHVEIGDLIELSDSKSVSYAAYGVYQCAAGIIETFSGKTYVFESILDTLTIEQKEIIDKASGGVVGGGKTALKNLAKQFQGKNIDIIEPRGKYRDFNFTIIHDEHTPEHAPVICYHQGNIEKLCKSSGAIALGLYSRETKTC